jgi:NADH:ubiquinone oxidoreductase subunit K
MLLSVELMFISLNLQFLFIASQTTYYYGYLYSLINIVLAASESVVGLTIIILLYKINDTIDYDSLTHLRH